MIQDPMVTSTYRACSVRTDTQYTHIKQTNEETNNDASGGESTEGHKNKTIPGPFCSPQHSGDASYWLKLAKTYKGREPNLLNSIKKQADQQ